MRRQPAERTGLALTVAEVALAGVTASTVFAFTRLFDGNSFLFSLAAVALYAHVTTALLRRRGVGLPTTTLVTMVGFVFLGSWLWLSDTLVGPFPTPATLSALGDELHQAWAAFQQVTAPVPANTGFVIAAGTALFLAIFLADWAAFRLWSPLEAIVPMLTLVVFTVLLGVRAQQVLVGTAVTAAVLAFLVAHRVLRLESTPGWARDVEARASRGLLGSGLALVCVAVLAGTLIAPRVPWVDAEGPLSVRRARNESSDRVVVSPLVDIRQRLVDQKDAVAFTVRATEPAYWRLTALDAFDGSIWKSSGRYNEADGSLDAEIPDGVAGSAIDQEFTIRNLRSLWLPAAYQPVQVDDASAGVSYQAESGTLIVDAGAGTSDGMTYRVTSDVPHPTAAQLDREGTGVPSALEHQLELPDDFNPETRELARSVVGRAGASNPYQQAMALQDFFLDRGAFANDGRQFTYQLSNRTVAGHSSTAIDRFLETGQGYCEQFAGTYAAMARSLGLPARVAVGFTWGTVDPADPTLYAVTGKNAHAWPEVWLGDDVGWVAFEPTPGRGAPGMEYADVAARQASVDGGTEAAPAPSATDQAGEGGTIGGSDPLDTPDAGTGSDRPAPAPTDAPAADEGADIRLVLLAGSGILLLGAVVYIVAVPVVVAVRTGRRRERAGTRSSAQVQAAWAESVDELALVGLVRQPHETYAEFGRRAAAALPDQAAAITRLSRLAEQAAYAPEGVDGSNVQVASEAARQLSAELWGSMGQGERLLHRYDPRRVVGQSSRWNRSRMR